MQRTRNYLSVILTGLIMMLVTGCDNSMKPLDEEKGQYSIYGGLDIKSEKNYVRVKDLNVPLDQDSVEFSASVTMENLKTGTSQLLSDSVIVFNGVNTHNFETTLPINPDTNYMVTIKGNDGDVQTARATTPVIADIRFNAQINTAEPVRYEDICASNFVLRFSPVKPDELIKADIGFEYDGNMYWLENQYAKNDVKDSTSTLTINPRVVIDAVLNPDGNKNQLPSGCVCGEHLTSSIFVVEYRHRGVEGGITQDTLRIPGGAGKLVGYYDDSFQFDILNLRDTKSRCFLF